MKWVKKPRTSLLLLASGLLAGLFLVLGPVESLKAETLEEQYQQKEEEIKELEQKIEELQSQEKTLTSQIAYLNGQIQLAGLKIRQTEEEVGQLEEEIVQLEDKISRLNLSLDQLSKGLLARISRTYRRGQIDELGLFLSSSGFSEFLSKFRYLRFIQKHDRKLLLAMEETRLNYGAQKKLKEEKQAEMEALKIQLGQQKLSLDTQKQEKQTLIEITRNDEASFQQLLEEARRERENLLAAFSALPEGEKKTVKKGEVIGIMGNSGFSTGPHLHFAVYHQPYQFGKDHEDPFSYLKSKEILFDSTSCDDTPEAVTRTAGSGSRSWPMSHIRLTQCYGHTPWSWRYSSNFHEGLDMVDDEDLLVRAVDDGEAVFYRGGQSSGNGVFIYHPDGKMTVYWHLQ